MSLTHPFIPKPTSITFTECNLPPPPPHPTPHTPHSYINAHTEIHTPTHAHTQTRLQWQGVGLGEEDVGLIGVTYNEEWIELVPWNAELEWDVDPWGRW